MQTETKYRVISVIDGEEVGIGGRFDTVEEAWEHMKHGWKIHPEFSFAVKKVTTVTIGVFDNPAHFEIERPYA